MHLDLKSPNILLALDGTAKIADVGLSRMFTTRSLPVAKVSTCLELQWLGRLLVTLLQHGSRAVLFDPSRSIGHMSQLALLTIRLFAAEGLQDVAA